MAKRPKTIAKKLAKSALSKKAENVLLFDLRKITAMADFFVICSGGSDAQVKAIADAVVEGAKKEKTKVDTSAAFALLTWVLIDLVDIVVHIFQPDIRDYYQIERLWGDAEIEKFED